eukprot:m.13880 g.13880  ORF g.13880 m.13880 type:complete len:298 (+) comp25279_c0_seq1:286-1179(+)
MADVLAIVTSVISAMGNITKQVLAFVEDLRKLESEVRELRNRRTEIIIQMVPMTEEMEQYLGTIGDLIFMCSEQKVAGKAKKGEMRSLTNLLRLLDEQFQRISTAHSATAKCIVRVRNACNDAKELASSKKSKAKKKQTVVRGVGGAASAVGLAAGTTLSIVAGVFTFGIGAIVGLSVTAGVTTVTGIGAAVGTAVLADDCSDVIRKCDTLSTQFGNLLGITVAVQNCLSDTHGKVRHALRQRDNIKERGGDNSDGDDDFMWLRRFAQKIEELSGASDKTRKEIREVMKLLKREEEN